MRLDTNILPSVLHIPRYIIPVIVGSLDTSTVTHSSLNGSVQAEQHISEATNASVVLSFSVSFHLVVSIRWHGHINDAEIKCNLRQTASIIQAMFSFANG